MLTNALSRTARRLWPWVERLNRRIERPAAKPAWAPAPLLKRKERSFPQLGFPRETDSLCPRCVKEVRTAILSGQKDIRELVDGKPGEIKAHIVERDGKILMEKECPKHGRFEDVMAIDPAFLRRLENLYPGRDFKAPRTPLSG